MRNLFIGLLILAAVVVGGAAIANTAYQAGLSSAITTAAANAPDGTVVTPVAPGGYPYGYGHGWGWGPGFGLFGLLGTLVVLFVIFALIRAAFWRGGRGPGGGPGGWGGGPGRFHDTFDDWHRQAHGESVPPKESSA